MRGIHVVAAVIFSPDRQSVLIARRPGHVHQGGLWEFPGGKVQKGEPARQALRRELMEELAIDMGEARPWQRVGHQYPDKQVLLDFWQVDDFVGEPRGNEGQEIAWVSLTELAKYPFPEANLAVMRQLVAGACS